MIISIGGQWTLLQTVAWMGMLVDYSRDNSVKEAICKTFDGKHPCCLCKAITAGKKTEQKKNLSFKQQKLEFPPLNAAWEIAVSVRFPLILCIDLSSESFFLKPPTPPPRSLPA